MRQLKQLKSEREIALMRRAGLAVWQAHQIASSLIEPGVTTASIDRAVEDYYTSSGCEPLFKDYPHPSRGGPPFPAVTCMSVNDEVVHGIPREQPLQAGDIVSIDTGARLDGWCGDAAVTYPVGEIASETQRLLDVTRGTLELAIQLMHEKSWWSQIADEMGQFVADNGFSTVECFVGHGIGREMHEEPQVPNFLSRSLRGSGDFRIEAGLVVAVEPMVNMGTKNVRLLSDDWTQATADGQPSAHFEHTLAITDKGVRIMTAPPIDGEEKLLPKTDGKPAA